MTSPQALGRTEVDHWITSILYNRFMTKLLRGVKASPERLLKNTFTEVLTQSVNFNQ